MTGDTAFISSEILSLNTLLFKYPHINRPQADSWGELVKKCRERAMDSRPQIHVFIKRRP